MRKSSKLITAVAVAGLAFAGGTALTGTGLATTAPTTQFIGGQVSQSVTGATLTGVTYGFADDVAKTKVKTITLAFSSDTADGVNIAVAPSGGSGGTFDCGLVAAGAATCNFVEDTVTAEIEDGYLGLTSLAITAS